MKKLMMAVLALVLVGLDQWSKLWVVANIGLGDIKPFLPPIFSLTYVQNSGAAFSILQDQQWFFTVVTLVFLTGAIIYFVKSKNHWLSLLPLTLMMAGGVGNFIDRLRLGYVIDMVHLDFMDFAIFNVADSYLTVGVALMFVALWWEERLEKQKP
ncbi:signal peptidase II [Streptococcus entericus]|uniref:signal peptidase II n=1 Tax=Streptococcus entericus TaxID=155680 RepID=UPI0003764DF3|nr:signal peptidase II [Streptococcus entericus]